METSEIVGKPLRQISFPKGALVIAILRGQEVMIPSGDSFIKPMDRILILSTQAAIAVGRRRPDIQRLSEHRRTREKQRHG